MRGYLKHQDSSGDDYYVDYSNNRFILRRYKNMIWEIYDSENFSVILANDSFLAYNNRKVYLDELYYSEWTVEKVGKSGGYVKIGIDDMYLNKNFSLDRFGAYFYLEPEIFSVGTFNLGFNVVRNVPEKSEKKLVLECIKKYGYPKGKIPKCTQNSLDYITLGFRTNYKYWIDIIGFQEVPVSHYNYIVSHIQDNVEPEKFPPNYQSYISTYGDRAVVTVANAHTVGNGVQLTDRNNQSYTICGRNDCRGVQSIWFYSHKLLFINIHMVHVKDNDSYVIADMIQRKCEVISKDHDAKGNYIRPKRVILVGDFNDNDRGGMKTMSLTIFGKTLQMRGDIPKTCCFDSNYIYYGDYIFDSHESEKKHLGMIENYRRNSPHMSDHDPVVYVEYKN
jgi:hypothetical protein